MVPSALMEALYLVRELFAGPEITLPFKSKIELWLGHNKLFDDEINKYSYNWRSGGQFATEERLDK